VVEHYVNENTTTRQNHQVMMASADGALNPNAKDRHENYKNKCAGERDRKSLRFEEKKRLFNAWGRRRRQEQLDVNTRSLISIH
jgi:hypothetical protein